MATCAACLQAIVRAERFMLDDTEVFHARCVGMSYRSKLRITEGKVRELEAQVADTRRAAARVEVEANRLRNDAASARAQAIMLEGRLAATQARSDQDHERLAARDEELREARRQLASLRSDLVALRPQEGSTAEAEDATVQRFRNLELD